QMSPAGAYEVPIIGSLPISTGERLFIGARTGVAGIVALAESAAPSSPTDWTNESILSPVDGTVSVDRIIYGDGRQRILVAVHGTSPGATYVEELEAYEPTPGALFGTPVLTLPDSYEYARMGLALVNDRFLVTYRPLFSTDLVLVRALETNPSSTQWQIDTLEGVGEGVADTTRFFVADNRLQLAIPRLGAAFNYQWATADSSW
ncbi:MAG: hypothetical protein ABI743_10570, partial [bacterium]